MYKEIVKRGEIEGNNYTTIIEGGKSNEDAFITIPAEIMERLNWKDDDEIELSVIENLFDWGEVSSVVLRNLTKEK